MRSQKLEMMAATRIPPKRMPAPRNIMSSLEHVFWGMAMIDMTPGYGEAASMHAQQCIRYLGIRHSEFQKSLILKNIMVEMMDAVKDPRARSTTPSLPRPLLPVSALQK